MLLHLALMMPSAPRPPVTTQRPCSASWAGLPGAGGAVITTYSGIVQQLGKTSSDLYPAADAAT